MPGLVPGIHVFSFGKEDVDGRVKPGHDELDEERQMATHKLLLLPGDGIGPEVMAEVKRLIDWLNAQGIAHFRPSRDWSAARPMTPASRASPTPRWRWRWLPMP